METKLREYSDCLINMTKNFDIWKAKKKNCEQEFESVVPKR